ncbi:hypothetical protein BD413DRAFT_468313 [Trametes elegans]|nr:hypothetical protein BD413DRAFT_468313 [Trametes elegans]
MASTSASSQSELIPLGYNWQVRFIHNPEHRSVRERYEAIPPDHDGIPAAEESLGAVVRVLRQVGGCRACIAPCLHRGACHDPDFGSARSVVLHVTLLDVQILDMLYLLSSTTPVHLYIGDPLTTGTPFDTYSPEKLAVPESVLPGDPIFSTRTERVTVLGAYLHPADDSAQYGLTVGHAVVPQASFLPHAQLLPRPEKDRRHVRNSRLALQHVGQPLSSPSVKVVERALQAYEAEASLLFADPQGSSSGTSSTSDPRLIARLHQYKVEHEMLRNALARPHELDIAHACAAEAIIRPCRASNHRGEVEPAEAGGAHTHLLSWALVRMSSRAGDNPRTLHAQPRTLARGAAVAMHVRDPNIERPLGPYRSGVVNGAPASVVVGGYVAREWAVFPAPGWAGIKFAARGDAGALITAALAGEREGSTAPLALLYAVPERGPYGLVTPLSTIVRRIRDVTGMELRFQRDWGRDENI